MSAPDLLGILHRIVRYIAIVSDAAVVSLRKHGDIYRLALVLNPGSRPVPHQRFAFDLLQFLSFCRWVTGADLKPVGVELSHPGDSSAAFEAAFGCLPRFGAEENALLFSSANATLPLPTAHYRLSAVHDRIATEHLQRFSGSQFTPRARTEIARCLHDGSPTRAAIAGALAVSERTLYRRLSEEGTSFQSLVEEARA